MKKLTFYMLENEPVTNAVKYHNNFRNKNIEFDEKEKIFQIKSKITGDFQTIEYSFGFLKIDSNITKTVKQILENSFIEAQEISPENFGQEINEGSLSGAIIQVLNKFCYKSPEEEFDFFDLSTDIFIKILMGHYLENGNKRIAIVFLKGFLWHFGYYLKWTQGTWKNYSTYKTKIENFVEELENKKDNNKEQTYLKIKGWITNNVIIGLNWRR